MRMDKFVHLRIDVVEPVSVFPQRGRLNRNVHRRQLVQALQTESIVESFLD